MIRVRFSCSAISRRIATATSTFLNNHNLCCLAVLSLYPARIAAWVGLESMKYSPSNTTASLPDNQSEHSKEGTEDKRNV